jgi:hypothetical protein
MTENLGYDPAHQAALEQYAEAHKNDAYVMPRPPDPTQERSYLDFLQHEFTAFPARDRFEAGGFRTYEQAAAAEEAMIDEYMNPERAAWLQAKQEGRPAEEIEAAFQAYATSGEVGAEDREWALHELETDPDYRGQDEASL